MVQFDRGLWQRSKRRAVIWKTVIILLTLVLAIVFFGVRDRWFTASYIFCWPDYLLYIILTIGLAISSKIKNYILFKSNCFVSSEQYDAKQSTSELMVAMNATIEGITEVLKEKD